MIKYFEILAQWWVPREYCQAHLDFEAKKTYSPLFEEGYEYGDYGEEGGFVMDAAEQDKGEQFSLSHYYEVKFELSHYCQVKFESLVSSSALPVFIWSPV